MAGEISVGSVGVDVVPDAKGWGRALETQIAPQAKAIGEKVGRQISDQIGDAVRTSILKLEVLEAEARRIGALAPTIQVDVDTAGASAQLAAFGSGVEALGASADISGTAKSFAGVSSSIGGSVSGLAAMLPLIAALGTALIPVVASVAGLAAVLTAPLAAVGGGLTIFGILGGKAIANTLKTSKEIDQLRKRARSLADPKAAKAAAQQADALEKSLTKPQQAFLKAKDSLSRAFGGLLGGKTGEALFAPIVAGMRLLAKIMPKLSPVIEAVSTSLTGLIDGLSRKVSGGGFSKFMESFASLAGSSLTALGKIAGNLAIALGNIFGAFAPAGQSFLDTLVQLSAKFAAFTAQTSTQEGLRAFIEYVKVNGPIVAQFFGRSIVFLTRVMIGLSSTGSKVLGVLNAISGAMNKVPTQAFVGTLGAVIGSVRLLGSALSNVRSKVSSMVSTFLAAPIRIISALAALPVYLFAVGANMISMLASGIASQVGKVASAVGKVVAATGPLGGLASKIPMFAKGTKSAPGGLAIVGERGPELVHLPRGSQVDPKLPKGGAISPMVGGSGLSKRDLVNVLNGMNITLNGQPARLQIAGA